MRRRTGPVMLMLTALVLAGCGSGGSTAVPATGGNHHAAMLATATAAPNAGQPYAGLQNRPIKALDPQRANDLLAGSGLG